MPIAVSSTDQVHFRGLPALFVASRRAVADLGPLLSFRVRQIRSRRGLRWAALGLLATTVGAATLPAFFPDAGAPDGRAFDFLVLLPTALAGFLVLTTVSAAASGGGRELLARDPASVYPISATTDHLGALILAPLNIAWMIQAWVLLGVTAFALGPGVVLLRAQVVILVWLVLATSFAQVLAWSLEAARRIPHGVGGVRALTVAILGVTLGLQVSGNLLRVFDQLPTRAVVVAMITGSIGRWAVTVLILVAVALLAVVIGAIPAHVASRRVPKDELSVETGRFQARGTPRSPLAGLIRTDRASVWRAVPMRRGLAVLAIGPGVVAVLGNLPWSSMTILPGLVASGGALLFGVNSWCLDGRGALWRESLPVDPRDVFDARAVVLAEFLMVASFVTIGLGAIRAGVPSVVEATAITCTLLVVTVQVVAAGMRWSAQKPYAVDLRSARATPAPPLSMVGYSTRLAISTTMTGLVFSGLAQVPGWHYSVLIAIPFLAWSGTRLLRTRAGWIDPVQRARIITTVAV